MSAYVGSWKNLKDLKDLGGRRICVSEVPLHLAQNDSCAPRPLQWAFVGPYSGPWGGLLVTITPVQGYLADKKTPPS